MRNNIEGYRQRYEQESADGQLSLTDRQVEVLRLAVDGLGNKEIGEELGIAIATVKVNMVEIFKAAAKADSTDHSNFWRVVKLAIQSGLIESPKADALVSRSKSDQRE
ncbi:MAG: LuxR C-terminal-related transcriptional regulator [bacterium]|nr:LuxR C-terminal-related transcriptional regulator [bacterium]